MKFIFNGQPLSKDNSKIMNKQGRFFLPRKYKDWETEKQWQFIIQKKKYRIDFPLPGHLEVWLYFYYRDHRCGDLGNAEKSICDAMNKFLWIDDLQIKIIHKYQRFDRDNPRIELEVKSITSI